jgi:hypothetical protein
MPTVADRTGATMMGTKERRFLPLVNPSLEDLVPADHFYRHLERSLALTFGRDLVRGVYADTGRPIVPSRQAASPHRIRLTAPRCPPDQAPRGSASTPADRGRE